MTLYNNVASNKRKTWLLLVGFSIFIIIVAFIFSTAMNQPAILYAVVIFSIVSSFVSYWWSDKIVLAMSNAHEVVHDSNKELFHIVENLCITAGLPVPKIYLIDDSAPNAFATGRDPEHAVIAVTSGLLEKLEKNELEGVIAHELSHIGNRDILLATIVTVLVGIVVLLADWFMRWSFFGGRRNNDEKGGGEIAAVITILAIVLSILAPFFAYMMQFSISRKREFMADSNAALLTRYPEGLARALEKISADTEPLEVANRATAHLYFSSPFKGRESKKISWLTKMFMTHPPVEERVRALRGSEK
ncbi:MAG: M48 family metallopeptidase [Candidatus Falkowbacteria bacterium]